MNLNKTQEEAVLYTEGPLLLLAGAGSGKTRVLVNRVAHLIEKGVRPFNILAITFTNKAAREMRERVEVLAGEGTEVWVSTFHSMCVRILRREIEKIGYDGKFTIYDTDDCQKLMKQIYKEQGINDRLWPLKSTMSAISGKKDMLITPAECLGNAGNDFKDRQIAQLYDAYQRRLKANNALDFDDLIFKTVELFGTHPDVLEKYQNRFLYIMVDEYQDTNFCQYRLINQLSAKYKNICVVGDDDQSIYGWRGADIRNILEFEKDYPGARVLRLEQNYRSTRTILEAANTVIKNNKRRKGKNLWTENDGGAPITYFKAPTGTDEAAFVVKNIIDRGALGEPYKSFAVLYRTNAQSRPIEDELVRKNVPYRVFGGVRFYERMEIKDALAYLKAVYNPLDDISLKRIINVPRRGIGDETVSKLEAYAAETEVPFYDALLSSDEITGLPYNGRRVREFAGLLNKLMEYAADNPVTDVLNKIFEETNYINELLSSEQDKDLAKERTDNVMELSAKAQEFVKQSADSGGDTSLAAFLEEVSLVADIDNYAESQDVVVLMTMHSSKGLEFNNVFIVGFEEGIFPGSRAAFSNNEGDMEEERRVCYVAITRAKKSLCITNAVQRRMYNEIVYNSPSRFLKELPQELINEVKQKKTADSARKDLLSERTVFTKRAAASAVKLPKPKTGLPDFTVNDYVMQKKYGRGRVVDMKPAGADYEVTVDFPGIGEKKFMANLSNLEKTL